MDAEDESAEESGGGTRRWCGARYVYESENWGESGGMEGDEGGRRKSWPSAVLEEKSLSEVFLGKMGDGWMVDGEGSMGEAGESTGYSDRGKNGSWVWGNGAAMCCCC